MPVRKLLDLSGLGESYLVQKIICVQYTGVICRDKFQKCLRIGWLNLIYDRLVYED